MQAELRGYIAKEAELNAEDPVFTGVFKAQLAQKDAISIETPLNLLLRKNELKKQVRAIVEQEGPSEEDSKILLVTHCMVGRVITNLTES